MFSKDSNCGNNKGCFSKCNKDGKCDYLLSWEPLDSLTSVRIKMKGNAGKGHYIAFGLSMDEKMVILSNYYFAMHCLLVSTLTITAKITVGECV